MNPNLYRSAMGGNVAELRQHKDVLDGELTPNRNTVLHVAAQFGHLDCVKEVLEACPSLLRRQNIKKETPLHTAARDGNAEIVEALILRAKELETQELESGWGGAVKEMLRATNVDGDTALHIAARNCHLKPDARYLKVVESLKKGLKYSDLLDSANMEQIMRATKDKKEDVMEIMRATKVNKEEVEEIMKATKVDRDTALHMDSLDSSVVGYIMRGLKVVREKVEEIMRATKVNKEVEEIMKAKKVDKEEAKEIMRAKKVKEKMREKKVEEIMRAKKVDRETVEEIMRATKVDKEEVKEIMRAKKVDKEEAKKIMRAKKVEEIMRAKKAEEIMRATKVDRETMEEIMRATKVDKEEVEEIMSAKRVDKKNPEKLMRAKKVDKEEVEEMMSAKKVDKEKAEELMRAKKVEEIMRATKVDKEEVEKIMRETKVDRDTALHKAATNRLEEENRDSYLEVVKLLSKEYAEFQHPPNNFQETPLYLAAERGIMGVAIVGTLVETHESLLTYSGPGGRTALHAAALHDSTGQSTKKLLEWKKDLINQADEYGWVPLHYAARNSNAKGVKELLAIDQSVVYITTENKDDQDAAATMNGNESRVRELLVMDESGAYVTTTNKDGLDTALHIAAAHGHEDVLEQLLSNNPDCWEMVNSKGQNVLHIAVDMNRDSVIDFILRNYSWVGQLINQKDNEGNTPLHLLIASNCYADKLWQHHRADHHAFNGKNMTPVDLVWSNLMEERMSTFAESFIVDDTFLNSGIEASGGRNLACNAHFNLAKLEKARTREKQKRAEAKKKEQDELFELSLKLFQTIVIVGALIATITFAAAFTVPGGYDGNQGPDQGMAILSRAAAFQAFVVTNTIAMVCSVTSIFLCLSAMGYSLLAKKEAVSYYRKRYIRAVGLIIVSMFFMMIAFIAATFAVLAHARALAWSTCYIVCLAFIGYIMELGQFFARLD